MLLALLGPKNEEPPIFHLLGRKIEEPSLVLLLGTPPPRPLATLPSREGDASQCCGARARSRRRKRSRWCAVGYMCICVYYIYIYIYRERERHLDIYIYIYRSIHRSMYRCIYIPLGGAQKAIRRSHALQVPKPLDKHAEAGLCRGCSRPMSATV